MSAYYHTTPHCEYILKMLRKCLEDMLTIIIHFIAMKKDMYTNTYSSIDGINILLYYIYQK